MEQRGDCGLGSVVAGVVGKDVGTEGGCVEVDINLGGGYRFVTEHLLDGAEIGSALEQMGCEGVTEGVGRDVFAYAGGLCKPFDYLKGALACETASTTVEKEDIFVSAFDFEPRTVVHPCVYLLDGGVGHGHHAFFIAFAGDHEETFARIELGYLEVDEFAHAESAPV